MIDTKSTPTDLDSDSTVESSKEPPEPQSDIVREEKEFVLPEPDPDNITVLTNKLPDTPILPWNRYDSPWRETEGEEGTTENGQREPEKSPQPSLESEETAASSATEEEEEGIAGEGVKEREDEEREIDEVE